jgi:hypothetical protein
VSKHATPRGRSPVGVRAKENDVANGSGEEVPTVPTPSDEAISLPALDGEAVASGRVAGLAGRSIRWPDETPGFVGPAEREVFVA